MDLSCSRNSASRLAGNAPSALDAALRSPALKEFYRGYGDANRYASVQRMGGDWLAVPADGFGYIVIEPVTPDFLEGLRTGGCRVESNPIQNSERFDG